MKFFDDVLGEILGRAAFQGVAGIADIDGERRLAGTAAEIGDAEPSTILGQALGAGLELQIVGGRAAGAAA